MGELPPLVTIRAFDTHRLIPSKYSQPDESVLARLAGEDDALLRDLFDLDHATNERLLAEHDRLPGIGLAELVAGVPHYRIVNAAFCHAHPQGSRFNGPERGAWYCSLALDTSIAEVAFHKRIELAEVAWHRPVAVTYDDYLADFTGGFHDLRGAPDFAACLDPASYVAAQALAQRVLPSEALGVVYPSVRHAGGTCIACLRPAAVGNVRKGGTLRLTFAGEALSVETA